MQSADRLQALRLHGLDSLRAVAILSVMSYHLQNDLPKVFEPVANMGWAGVDLFFVLSGFLIGTQLLKPYLAQGTVCLREFYSRRAYRILPSFVVVLVLYFTVPAWREAAGPAPWWEYATFTWNLFTTNFPNVRAFSHVWSLCVEEHFYLVLPALVLWRMRRPSLGKTVFLLGALVAGGMVIRGWELFHVVRAAGLSSAHADTLFMKRIYYPTYSRLDGLIMGVALALLKTFRSAWWAKLAGRGYTLSLCGVLLVAAAFSTFRWDYPWSTETIGVLFGFPLLSLGLAFLVASSLCHNGPLRTRVPGAAALATLAYSLYLTHKSVAHVDGVLFPWLQQSRGWQAVAIYAVSCVAVASLLYFAVERPFLLLRSRVHGRGKNAVLLAEREVRLDPAL